MEANGRGGVEEVGTARIGSCERGERRFGFVFVFGRVGGVGGGGGNGDGREGFEEELFESAGFGVEEGSGLGVSYLRHRSVLWHGGVGWF